MFSQVFLLNPITHVMITRHGKAFLNPNHNVDYCQVSALSDLEAHSKLTKYEIDCPKANEIDAALLGMPSTLASVPPHPTIK